MLDVPDGYDVVEGDEMPDEQYQGVEDSQSRLDGRGRVKWVVNSFVRLKFVVVGLQVHAHKSTASDTIPVIK